MAAQDPVELWREDPQIGNATAETQIQQPGPQSRPSTPPVGAPPSDVGTRIKEREWLQWRFEQANQVAIAGIKSELAGYIQAEQQSIQEDAYPQAPEDQAMWMAQTRASMEDGTLPEGRLARRMKGAPDEIRQELEDTRTGAAFQKSIRQQGEREGRRFGVAARTGAGGKEWLETLTLAKDDVRKLYDIATRYGLDDISSSTSPEGTVQQLAEKLRDLGNMGGPWAMSGAKPFGEAKTEKAIKPGGHERLLPRERQRDVFFEAAKKGYQEELEKQTFSGKALGKIGSLAGFFTPGGGITALKAGRALAIKGSEKILGRTLSRGAATMFGWMGATAAGGAFETAHPLSAEDKQGLDHIRESKGDKAAEEAEGALRSLRLLTGIAKWGTIEALGIPLGKIGTAAGERLPGAAAAAKRILSGAAAGAALEPATALADDNPAMRGMYRTIVGQDPEFKTNIGRAFALMAKGDAAPGEVAQAWKSAFISMGAEAATFAGLHALDMARPILPPSMQTRAQEVASQMRVQARDELRAKDVLPEEVIQKVVPSPEERPVEVPLAGRPETFQEAQAARRREQIISPERQEELGRGALELLMEAKGEATPAKPPRKTPRAPVPEQGAPRAQEEPGQVQVTPRLKDATRRATEAAEARRKAETTPEAKGEPVPEAARREVVAKERQWIAEKQRQAQEEGRQDVVSDLDAYRKRFDDESRGEGYVPDVGQRPASASEVGKPATDPVTAVQRAMRRGVKDSTIQRELKRDFKIQRNEARKLIAKERGEEQIRALKEQEFQGAEGLPEAKAAELKDGLTEGTSFRLRDLFDGRELTVRRNEPGGPLTVSDGDRQITLAGPELTRIDPASVVRPEAAPLSAPSAPLSAPSKTVSVRPEEAEAPLAIRVGGKSVPVRIRQEEGKLYATASIGKGDNVRVDGASLAEVHHKLEQWAARRAEAPGSGKVSVEAVTKLGGQAAQAAEFGRQKAAEKAAKASEKRQKEQEAREVAEQEKTPQGVDALEKAIREAPSEPAAPGAVRPAVDPSHPEAGVLNVGAMFGARRGEVSPFKSETTAEMLQLYGGMSRMIAERTGLVRALGGFFSRATTLGHRPYNVAHRYVAMSKRMEREVRKKLLPALREFPRDEEGKVLAFDYYEHHTPDAIQAMKDWTARNGKDWGKQERHLETLREMHQHFRKLMNENDPRYLNASRDLRDVKMELADPSITAKERQILEAQRVDLEAEVQSLMTRGVDEYIKHVFDPANISAYGGKIYTEANRIQARRIHGSMLKREGAEGYVKDVFVAADRYFFGMIRAIHGSRAAMELDTLMNGSHRAIGGVRKTEDGGTWDPLDGLKKGEQYFYRRTIGADPEAAEGSGMKTERNLVRIRKWDKEARELTVEREDSGREFVLTEKQARQLYRKRGGLLDAAARSANGKWRGKEFMNWFDQEIMGKWVERGVVEKVVGRISRAMTSWLAHVQLGALAGNIVTPMKTWAMGHMMGATKRGLLPYTEAIARYMRDPALRKIVEESGALDIDRLPFDALSEARVFPGLLAQAKEKLGVANMALMRITDKHNRASAAANGVLELQAYARKFLKREATTEELHMVARQWADESQLATDSALAGRYWTGAIGVVTRPVFQFSRPQFRIFESLLSDARRGDPAPFIRGIVYASVMDMLLQAATSMVNGNSFTLFGDFGVRVDDLGAAGEYLKKKLGKEIGNLMLIPGFPLKSIMEGKPPGLQWLGAFTGVIGGLLGSEARPEMAAEQFASLTYGPGLRKARQAISARPIREPGHEDEVEIPHPATMGEALNPINLKFTGQAGQRMPKNEPIQKFYTPGTSVRSGEAWDLRKKLQSIGEEMKDAGTRQNQALMNMRRAMREGREKDADIFRAEHLQLRQETGRPSDMDRIVEMERWEKLPPEVRQLAHASKEARLQMVSEILEDTSSPYSLATKRDIVRIIQMGADPFAGTTPQTRQRYSAARQAAFK